MKFNIIAAICKYNNGIGLDGRMPWYIQEDLKYFSNLTKGSTNYDRNAVIMGSNTYRSLGAGLGIGTSSGLGIGLSGRDNLILSSTLSLNFVLKDKAGLDTKNIVKSFKDIYDVIHECYANNYDTVWIIGGSSIYRQFINFKYKDEYLINKCYVTLIHKWFDCDATFPYLSLYDWTITSINDSVDVSKYDYKIEFLEYNRVTIYTL